MKAAMSSLLRLLALVPILMHSARALPLCSNQEAPRPAGSLKFCSQYSGATGCCSADADAKISSQFQALNISDSSCANYVKQVLCAQCDPFAADLFAGRSVPLLCNTTSDRSNPAYCSSLWKSCQNVNIPNSPFSPNLILSGPGHDRKATVQNQTLSGQWQTVNNFCESLGSPGNDQAGNLCFSGGVYKFPAPTNGTGPQGVCLDKVDNDGYIGMVPHPDGSNRAFMATQQGKIYLATLPEEGSGRPMSVGSTPFLDISNYIVNDRELGLMSVAFHPDFTTNGRFFVSYNCDKKKWAGCGGRCSCNADVGCDLSKVTPGETTVPCQSQSVISEFVAGNSTVPPSRAVVASSDEVKRIFTMGLPSTTHHGGLLLFGPADKYLYFMMGDGGGVGDPFNFAQNKKSLLGKILRLDVDKAPGAGQQSRLWGNYSIPEDNPFAKENGSAPEIWALGLRNPWRCSFDAAKPEYLYCADVGQNVNEEVNLITKGGNYGWRVYDGFDKFTNTSAASIQPIFPVATYLHDDVKRGQGSASIIGGYVSRSVLDPCLYGRYLFADLYAGNMWTTTENPEGSGNYTMSQPVNFACSPRSPISCKLLEGTRMPDAQFFFAWGEDNSRDVYILAVAGVYKVVSPDKCSFTCTRKLPPSVQAPALTPIPSPPASPPRSDATRLRSSIILLLALLVL